MSNITFKPRFRGGCPEYRTKEHVYYIQDREAGADCYEYALYRSDNRPPAIHQKFNDYESMVKFLGIEFREKDTPESIIRWCGHAAFFSCNIREYGGYFVDFSSKEIWEVIDWHIEQISYWAGYSEILKWSKDYINELEKPEYEQMTLFE